MRSGEHDVARAYVLYREERARLRAQQKAAAQAEAKPHVLNVVEDGVSRPLDLDRLQASDQGFLRRAGPRGRCPS